MRRYTTIFILIGILLFLVVYISWKFIPAWHSTPGGFWSLIGVASLDVVTFVAAIISIVKDLKGKKHDNTRPSQSGSLNIGGNVTQTGDQNIVARTIYIEHRIGHQTNIYNQKDFIDISGEKTSVIIEKTLANKIDKLDSLITTETEKRLSEYRIAWREGRKTEVYQWLDNLKADTDKWNALTGAVQAKILRFESSLEIYRTKDIVKAKQLADQAKVLSPVEDDSRIRSIIAFHETGPSSALIFLENKNDIDSINLRAAFLLELGKTEECQELLNEALVNKGLEPDEETYRLRALVSTLLFNINQAQVEIQKAISLSPNWESIKYTKAIVDYFSSISPIAIQSDQIYWPIPIPIDLVKSDDESRNRLFNASKSFRDSSKSP